MKWVYSQRHRVGTKRASDEPRWVVRAYLVETNKRYPLSEIRKAKAEKRRPFRLDPQTKAAHW